MTHKLIQNELHYVLAPAPQANAFVSDSNFSSVFGASEPVGKKIRLINQKPFIDMTLNFVFIFDAIPLKKFIIHTHTSLYNY